MGIVIGIIIILAIMAISGGEKAAKTAADIRYQESKKVQETDERPASNKELEEEITNDFAWERAAKYDEEIENAHREIMELYGEIARRVLEDERLSHLEKWMVEKGETFKDIQEQRRQYLKPDLKYEDVKKRETFSGVRNKVRILLANRGYLKGYSGKVDEYRCNLRDVDGVSPFEAAFMVWYLSKFLRQAGYKDKQIVVGGRETYGGDFKSVAFDPEHPEEAWQLFPKDYNHTFRVEIKSKA